MARPSKEEGGGFIVAIDRQHILEELSELERAIDANTMLCELAIAEKSMTAITTLTRQKRDLTADRNRRRAELRALDGVAQVDDPDGITAEICAVVGGDWPTSLVEQIYRACRTRLRLDDFLPEPPAHLWH